MTEKKITKKVDWQKKWLTDDSWVLMTGKQTYGQD